MAPKAQGQSLASGAIGSPRTRSASKGNPGNNSNVVASSGVSKGAAKVASKRDKSSASTGGKNVAGGGVAPTGSKAGNATKATIARASKANPMSPVMPVNLNSALGNASGANAAPDAPASSNVNVANAPLPVDGDAQQVAEPPFLSLSDEQLFDLIATKVQRFDRFKEAWMALGNLNPNTISLAYDAKFFVSDIMKDVQGLDRASAHSMAVFVMDKLARSSTLSNAVRLEWAHGWSSLTRQD